MVDTFTQSVVLIARLATFRHITYKCLQSMNRHLMVYIYKGKCFMKVTSLHCVHSGPEIHR